MDFAFVAAPTLVRAKPFHLLSQIARLLERTTGAFIAAQPQGRSKRIFTKKAIREDESFRYDPSYEKEHSKIRRFFECSKYKNKISTDNGEAYAELF